MNENDRTNVDNSDVTSRGIFDEVQHSARTPEIKRFLTNKLSCVQWLVDTDSVPQTPHLNQPATVSGQHQLSCSVVPINISRPAACYAENNGYHAWLLPEITEPELGATLYFFESYNPFINGRCAIENRRWRIIVVMFPFQITTRHKGTGLTSRIFTAYKLQYGDD